MASINDFCFAGTPASQQNYALGSSFSIVVEYTISKEVMLIVDLVEASPPAGCPSTNLQCPYAQGTIALGGTHSASSGTASVQVTYNYAGHPGEHTVEAWMVDKDKWDSYGDGATGWEITRRQEPLLVGYTSSGSGGYTVTGNLCPVEVPTNKAASGMLVLMLIFVLGFALCIIGFCCFKYVLPRILGSSDDKKEGAKGGGEKGTATGLADRDSMREKEERLADLEKQLQAEKQKNTTLKGLHGSTETERY